MPKPGFKNVKNLDTAWILSYFMNVMVILHVQAVVRIRMEYKRLRTNKLSHYHPVKHIKVWLK